MVLSTYLCSAFLLLSSVVAFSPLDSFIPIPVIPDLSHEVDISDNVFHFNSNKKQAPYNTLYHFDQLIDHNKPELGTFKQRYWFSEEFYEPGGPIILATPGEVDASGFNHYLTNASINGMIAEALHGATINLEHRFYGASNPYPDLSVESLQVHTIQQALDDFEYFAKNVVLPMDGGDQLQPGLAAWIIVGGSYSGALAGFAMHTKPNLWFAAYSSSGVVQARGDFWDYFKPIQEYMPKNCSNDLEAVIRYVDSELQSGDSSREWAVKQNFGMGPVKHNDDFVNTLRNPLFAWQSGSITSTSQAFYDFCDALEVNARGEMAPEKGWGLQHAFNAMGNFWNTTQYKNSCGNRTPDQCLDSWNPAFPGLNNVKSPSSSRSWKWQQCNEFGFWHAGAPAGTPSLISHELTTTRSERNCDFDFPGAFEGIKRSSFLNALGVNSKYGGWDNKASRIVFANGRRDPWREATVAAEHAPPSWNTYWQPHLISDGFHCSDMSRAQGRVSKEVGLVQEQAINYMKLWFEDWEPTEPESD